MGVRQLTVRLPLVAKALDRFNRIADRSGGLKANRSFNHPFNLLDFELRNLNAGSIRRDVAPYLDREDEEFIAMLRPGEYWALAILTAKQEPEDPSECQNTELRES